MSRKKKMSKQLRKDVTELAGCLKVLGSLWDNPSIIATCDDILDRGAGNTPKEDNQDVKNLRIDYCEIDRQSILEHTQSLEPTDKTKPLPPPSVDFLKMS